MLRFTIYTFTLLSVAIVWSFPASEDSHDGEEVKHCEYHGIFIKEGETVPAPIGQCRKVTCKSASPVKILSLTCPMWQLEPGSKCHKSEIDLTKPYPKCCPKEICDEE